MASAYNPATKTLFIPLNNMCMGWKVVAQQPLVGEDYGRGRLEYRHSPGSDGFVGRVDAINLETEQPSWTHQQRPYWSSSLLATGGGIVFGGDTSRRAFALDAATGKVLWELPLNSQPAGYPMTYLAGGKQYVAIPADFSLIGNRAAHALTPEIPIPSHGSTLMVFTLSDPDPGSR
jgi:alcohol dehydrogenase (cytochrome c)